MATKDWTSLRLAAYATTAALALALPATAHAGMELGAQNDYRMVLAGQTGGTGYLQRADELGATTVRMMVQDTRWNAGQADEYIRAAQQAKANGKAVIVALNAWETTPNPAEWSAYAHDVVSRMAPFVDAWSPMNEPNFPKNRAASPIECEITMGGQSTPVASRVANGVRVERRWKHVKRGKGTHLRSSRRQRGVTPARMIHTFKRAKGKRQHRRAGWKRVTRRVNLTKGGTVLVSSPAERRSCAAWAWGTAYRGMYDQVAPVIRNLDPSAALIVGDLAPSVDNETFMDSFYGVTPPATADVLGVHPYYDARPEDEGAAGSFSLPAIERTAGYARRHGLELWATEWALHPDLPGAYWTRALNRMEAAGARLTVLYDTSGPTWDTELRPDAVAALLNR